jgi:hypothetical protein
LITDIDPTIHTIDMAARSSGTATVAAVAMVVAAVNDVEEIREVYQITTFSCLAEDAHGEFERRIRRYCDVDFPIKGGNSRTPFVTSGPGSTARSRA